MCWRRFVAQQGDCQKSQIAPLNAIIIIIIKIVPVPFHPYPLFSLTHSFPLLLFHIEGSQPEWCISRMIYSGDTPSWSENLDMHCCEMHLLHQLSPSLSIYLPLSLSFSLSLSQSHPALFLTLQDDKGVKHFHCKYYSLH